METMVNHKKRLRVSKTVIILSAICLLTIGASIFFYLQYSNTQREASQQKDIITKVGQSVELPNESPTVVTVSNKDRLTNKQLASKVENNDVLLVFAQAKRLVIYRPSNKKVANMLSFDNPAEVTTTAPSSPSTTSPAQPTSPRKP